MTGTRRGTCDCCDPDPGGCVIDNRIDPDEEGASWCCNECEGWYPDFTERHCIDITFYMPQMTWYQICDEFSGDQARPYIVRSAWQQIIRLGFDEVLGSPDWEWPSGFDQTRCSFNMNYQWNTGGLTPFWPHFYEYDCDGNCTNSWLADMSAVSHFDIRPSGGRITTDPADIGPPTNPVKPWVIASPCDEDDDFCQGIVISSAMRWQCYNEEIEDGECVESDGTCTDTLPVTNPVINEYFNMSYYNGPVTDCESKVAWLGRYATGTPDNYKSMLYACSDSDTPYCQGSAEYAKDYGWSGHMARENVMDCDSPYRACVDVVPFIISIEPWDPELVRVGTACYCPSQYPIECG